MPELQRNSAHKILARFNWLGLGTVALAFALWCGFALHGDLAQLSPAVLLRAWPVMVTATLLSLLNYALRVVRWRYYLARLGHPVPHWFAALTFTAGQLPRPVPDPAG